MPGRISGSSLQGLQLLAARTAPVPQKALVGGGEGRGGGSLSSNKAQPGDIQDISRFTGDRMGLGGGKTDGP